MRASSSTRCTCRVPADTHGICAASKRNNSSLLAKSWLACDCDWCASMCCCCCESLVWCFIGFRRFVQNARRTFSARDVVFRARHRRTGRRARRFPRSLIPHPLPAAGASVVMTTKLSNVDAYTTAGETVQVRELHLAGEDLLATKVGFHYTHHNLKACLCLLPLRPSHCERLNG